MFQIKAILFLCFFWIWAHAQAQNDAFLKTNTPYTLSLEGVTDEKAIRLIKKTSDLYVKQENSSSSWLNIYRRTQTDLEKIPKAMASVGYLDATVDIQIDQKASHIRIKISQGTRYTLKQFTPIYDHVHQNPDPIPLDEIGLSLGTAVDAETIKGSEKKTLSFLKNHGYPYAQIGPRVDLKDDRTKTLHVIQTIHQGPRVYFGKIHLEGLGDLPEPYVLRRIHIREGDLFSTTELEQNKNELLQSKQFAFIESLYPKELSENEHVPITFKLLPRKPRTIQGGVRLSSDEVWNVKGGWEHRNLTGRADTIGLDALYGKYRKDGLIHYQLPDFYGYGNQAHIQLRGTHENNYLYKTKNTTPEIGVHRIFSKRASLGVALNYEQGTTKQYGKPITYNLIGTPIRFHITRTDNPENPMSGWALKSLLFPQIDTSHQKKHMMTTQLKPIVYIPFGPQKKSIGSFWAQIDLLHGLKRSKIPANKRIYAGGQDSLRAYRYLLATPLDSQGNPLGGRSAYQIGAETRIYIAPKIHFIPFYEGGYVTDRHFPRSKDTYLSGVGLGMSYDLSLAPLRIDIAFPLKRRKMATGKRRDDLFKIYFSIGKPF